LIITAKNFIDDFPSEEVHRVLVLLEIKFLPEKEPSTLCAPSEEKTLITLRGT
jgi:hypothetical protein